MKTWNVHRWVVALMLVVMVGSLGAWWWARDPLPGVIRIGTAKPGNLYESFGQALAQQLRARTGHRVAIVHTQGSVENSALLQRGEVDLAIVQATALRRSAITLPDLAVLAPLYPEVLHVIVRVDSTATSILDLPGRPISIGPEGSGMRESAKAILEHYRIDPDELGAEANRLFFEALAETVTRLEGAIVTTGLDNPALCALLDRGDYRLLPVMDAEAISLANAFFDPFVLPRGVYDERPPVPAQATPTVASTAVLVARKNGSASLVRAALGALYARDLRPEFPHLIPESEALDRGPVPMHSAAREYLDPYAGLDVFANFVESLSGIKELLVGFVALAFLAVNRLRRLERRRRSRELQAMKDHLDEFLTRTVSIERAQMETEDPARLREYLREVTRVKLEALEELTAEDLRADQSFQIFLIQCANLSRKIQGRLQLLQGS